MKPTSAAGLEPFVGERVTGQGAVIESVPADEGFWIGQRQKRVFVRLTQPTESGFEARTGQHVNFVGTIVSTKPGFAKRLRVTRSEGAAELRQRPHIQAAQRNVDVR